MRSGLKEYVFHLNLSVQLNHTVDRPGGQLRRDLPTIALVVRDNGSSIGFGGSLDARSLTFRVGHNGAPVRFGGSLDAGSLTLRVGHNGTSVRFGRSLNAGALTLKVPLDGLGISLSG